MKPTDLPPAAAIAAGARRARVLRALTVLEYAAVDCLDDDRAVAHAVRLLRGPKPPAPPQVRLRVDGTTEWLELPGVTSVRWT